MSTSLRAASPLVTLAAVGLAAGAACSTQRGDPSVFDVDTDAGASDSGPGGGSMPHDADDDGDADADGGDGPKLDVAPGDSADGGDEGGPSECPPAPPQDATLTGVVVGPSGELPISGAVVWVQADAPEGIPDHVYCEACVEIPCDVHHTITGADGSFALEVPPGDYHFVVRKGHFMRSTPMHVADGMTALTGDPTRLPDHRDPASGQWIPNIALAWGDYDALQDALAKLGLGELSPDGHELDPGTESFDVYDNQQDNVGYEGQNPITTDVVDDFTALVSDPVEMAKYHVIFVPCSHAPQLGADQIDNIREWVAAGGRWYVADWSLEWLESPFAQYQDWWEDGFTGGPYLDSFDTTGHVRDDGLAAWLAALPPALADINPQNPGNGGHPTLADLPDVGLVDLWSTIRDAPPVLVDDGNGGQVDVGHERWLDGPGDGEDGAPADADWPLTVTAQYGCGKLMFTSYHTVEWEKYAGLTPQELVLMYLVIEIGTCHPPFDPPPPAG